MELERMTNESAGWQPINPKTGTVLSWDELKQLANPIDEECYDAVQRVAQTLLTYLARENQTDEELVEELEGTVDGLREALEDMREAVPDGQECHECDGLEYETHNISNIGQIAFTLLNRGYILVKPPSQPTSEEADRSTVVK
jgi:hypothetical protein